MAGVEEAGAIVGDAELLDVGDVARILNGDGRMVGENVKEGDGVVGHLVGARIENLDDAVGAFAAAQGHGNDGAHPALPGGKLIFDARIVLGFRNDERLAVLGHPAGHALADFDAQVAEHGLLAAGGNGVVEFLGRFVEHQQGPQLGFDDALHVLEDGAQNGVEIEARGERPRQLVEDQQVGEGHAIFSVVSHLQCPILSSILSHGEPARY